MHFQYSEAVMVVANTHADLGHYALADSLYRDAVAIDSVVLIGEQRERLGTSLNNYATALVDQQKYAESVDVFRQALEIRTRYLHPTSKIAKYRHLAKLYDRSTQHHRYRNWPNMQRGDGAGMFRRECLAPLGTR